MATPIPGASLEPHPGVVILKEIRSYGRLYHVWEVVKVGSWCLVGGSN